MLLLLSRMCADCAASAMVFLTAAPLRVWEAFTSITR